MMGDRPEERTRSVQEWLASTYDHKHQIHGLLVELSAHGVGIAYGPTLACFTPVGSCDQRDSSCTALPARRLAAVARPLARR